MDRKLKLINGVKIPYDKNIDDLIEMLEGQVSEFIVELIVLMNIIKCE